MTPSRPPRSAGSVAATCASVRKAGGLGVIETAIGRFTGLVDEVTRCGETDLDPASIESANMDSRRMVLEWAMLDSPEFQTKTTSTYVRSVRDMPTPIAQIAETGGGMSAGSNRAPWLARTLRTSAASRWPPRAWHAAATPAAWPVAKAVPIT